MRMMSKLLNINGVRGLYTVKTDLHPRDKDYPKWYVAKHVFHTPDDENYIVVGLSKELPAKPKLETMDICL